MTTTKRIHNINVRMPSEITEWLDSLIKQGIYKSRSEAIRDYLRKYIEEQHE